MPPLVIPDTIQVVATGQLAGGENWANVWHVRNPTSLVVDQVIADAIGADFRQFYFEESNFRGTGWTMDQITVRSIGFAGLNVFTASVAAVTGQDIAIPLPYECAIVITLHTALNTRRGRGRSYQSGFCHTVNVENAGAAPVLDSTAAADMAASMAALITALQTEGFPLGVASRADLQTREVTGGYIDTGWDTQRGRSNDVATSRANF